jgi:predicted ferric reductase
MGPEKSNSKTRSNLRKKRQGFHPVLLLAGYLVLALSPLLLAYGQGAAPRAFQDELASGLALVGFAMLLLEFLLSGRFRTISGRIGIDLTMWFHQLVARSLTIFLLAHPFLYSTPLKTPMPWDSTRLLTLGLEQTSIITGLFAWLLLAVLVLTSIFRDQLPYRYETWRLAHGIGAILIAGFGLHHALEAGRYSAEAYLATFWLIMFALASLTVCWVYVITPWRQLKKPYRVASVRRVALKTWAIDVEPTNRKSMLFEAGQFAWITLGRSPFAIMEHPFSMSSCPADQPKIEFTIKEVGDFTKEIGKVPVDTPAFLDGPHGNLTLTGRKGVGVAFIVGGVGLAPSMSILRQLRVERDPRPMVLIYGNRCAEQILYGSELEAMKLDLKLDVHHVLSDPPPTWEGLQGRLDRSVLDNLLSFEGRNNWLFFVCGPASMIDSVEDDLTRLGIPMRQIISEKFSYN